VNVGMYDVVAEHEWLLRIVVGLVCGGVVGFEREMVGKTAGWRTNMLVGLGAAAYTVLVEQIVLSPPPGEWARADPTRVIEGVVAGVGFLGAGVILHSHRRVHGVTTAAAMWVAGAIGIAAGLGRYDFAVGTTAITVFVLWVLRLLERRIGVRIEPASDNGHVPPGDRQ